MPQSDNGGVVGDEMLDARRRGRRGPILWIAAAVVVGGVALGVWLSGSSQHRQPSSALASIAAEHGGGSLPVTVPAETSKPPPTLSGLVSVAPAIIHAQGLTEVRNVLTNYFTAINDHNDYAGWAATLVRYSDRPTKAQYDGYETTHDSNISINSLRSTTGGQWQVSVSFTSRQNPKYADGNECLNWSIRYTLRPSRGHLRIDTVHSSTLVSLTC
jgi:hypothetical protein